MRLWSNGPDETLAHGRRLGALLKAGSTVCLFGELGSGKTVFVKGLASALGIPERDITSASFTIIAEYVGRLGGSPVPFYHIDLYRVMNAGELDSIGVEEYIGTEGVSVIEWADRMAEIEDCIAVRFSMLDGEKREITIEGLNEEDWNNL
ncbi:MAG TPA: tRNA (adenosine(37)-N6)-threonylcarbamoyltransferase complex ATPase subunit type 1 TsaE [Thermodesulfovibrionales bacterium]|nr:tRNA (adenosine(37)-N6)-threonylcarbamoyltransferase complex ATPase subunit type 1 TsaE [Thermodesulfovibrionales bacterium]